MMQRSPLPRIPSRAAMFGALLIVLSSPVAWGMAQFPAIPRPAVTELVEARRDATALLSQLEPFVTPPVIQELARRLRAATTLTQVKRLQWEASRTLRAALAAAPAMVSVRGSDLRPVGQGDTLSVHAIAGRATILPARGVWMPSPDSD